MSNRIIVTNFDYKTKMQCNICGKINILYFICAEYNDRSKTAIHMCKDCCKELAEKILESLEGKS